MKSQRKKKEKGQPGGLRSYQVMLPETYRRTRSPVWFEGTHLQVFQDSEQGVIPMIYRGKEEAVMLDPRAIVFTPLTEKLSQVDYSPRYFALDDHAPWAREWLLSASPLGGAGLRARLGAGHHAGEEGAARPWVGMEPEPEEEKGGHSGKHQPYDPSRKEGLY